MRRFQTPRPSRRGAVLPLVALCMLPIMAILALAIDLGMFTLARSQLQASADAAALAGVRQLTGDYSGSNNGNYAGVQGAATAAVTDNRILNKQPFLAVAPAPAAGTVTTNVGHFRYNNSTSAFEPLYPGGASPAIDTATNLPYAWSLVNTNLAYPMRPLFAPSSWNFAGVTLQTTATAVHRPRDVALILDLSGSMGFDSTLGADWSGTRFRTNSPDRAFPRFGHYAYAWNQSNGTSAHDYDMYHGAAVNNGANRNYNVTNFTVNPSTVDSAYLDAPPIVDNFYASSGGSLVPAWPAADFPAVASNSYMPGILTLPLSGAGSTNTFQDQPGGDRSFLRATAAALNAGSDYARTVQELTNGASATTRDNVATRTFGADFEIFGYGLLGRTTGTPRFAGNLSTNFRTSAADPDNGFAGYTQGPRYWGKTFWQWPADPRTPVAASARLTWNAGTGQWARSSSPGVLNQWLIELDRNWLLVPNGIQANTLPAVRDQNGVVGLTRYAAGSYDALLAHWPVLGSGAANPAAWTRLQVERFLRGLDPTTGADLRLKAMFASAQNRSGTNANNAPAATACLNGLLQPIYRAPIAPPVGTSWQYGATAAFWNGPAINPDTGAAVPSASAIGPTDPWDFPRCSWNAGTSNWSSTPSDGTLRLEGTPYNAPAKRSFVGGAWQDTASAWTAPSPALLGPTDPLPTDGVDWGATPPTQAQLDAQLARMILGLYDNAAANYDWRSRYCTANASPTSWPNNTVLFQSRAVSGVSSKTSSVTGHYQRVPENVNGTTTYRINYEAILNWIKNVGPNPFPANLQSGRIVYYNSIPDSIALPVPTDPDEMFWKEYIDWTLGFARSANINNPQNYDDTQTQSGFGRDFAWPDSGNVKSAIGSKPGAGSFQGGTVVNANNTSAALPNWPGKAPFQNYADSPMRPKTRGWFGPLTMIDFMANQTIGIPLPGRYGTLISGAAFQSQAAACKMGVRAALLDSKQNHPNDAMGLICFSGANMTYQTPYRFQTARSGLGTDYGKMVDFLFFPPSTVRGTNTTINWTDDEMAEVPHAYGGTCYDYPLMLAFNQFSTNSTLLTANSGLPRGNAGGMGRRGAQKIVIFETDGMPNVKCAVPTLQGSGDGSYYGVTANTTPALANASGAALNFPSIVTQLVNTTANGGFSYNAKPALVHAIGYGFLFEPTYTPVGSPSDTATALAAMGTIQANGNVNDAADGATLFTHPIAGSSTVADYKIITGNFAQRVDKMRHAFTHILQEKTVQVSLVQ